jgi:hypothetical protein
LGFNHQIQQVHTPSNVFITTRINYHTQNTNPKPAIFQFLVLFKIEVNRPQKQQGEKPPIDYTKSIMMTIEHYSTTFEQKAFRKEATTREREEGNKNNL